MSHYASRRGKHSSRLAKGVRRRREERFEKSSVRDYSTTPNYAVVHVQRDVNDISAGWTTMPANKNSWF